MMSAVENNKKNYPTNQQINKKIITVRELLNDSTLHIPNYQRPYKWTTKHINQLIADIKLHQNKSSYRLGTIVLHEQVLLEGSANCFRNNIVDGQQRTISLLLMVRALVIFRKEELENKNLKIQLDQLQHSMINPQFQSDISKTNIYQNYLEIARIISRPDFSEDLIDFLLNKCCFVMFALQDISEAFQFFDAQNARGRDLESHDLLKAYHLREFNDTDEALKIATVAHWENCATEQLAQLFALYLYRIRNWAKGNSARYFGKDDTALFKGINLEKTSTYPYIKQLNITHYFIDQYNQQYERKIDRQTKDFPFQLDQTILNGRRFFEMVTHYQDQVQWLQNFNDQHKSLNNTAAKIIQVINSYKARQRTGDQYVRSLFNCLLLYYIDRFGDDELNAAIEKIFIWSYSLRLKMHAISITTLDNYALDSNLFKLIKEAIYPSDFLNHSPPALNANEIKATRIDEIQALFKEMKYCE